MAIAAITALAIPGVRWRAEVVMRKAGGELPELGWARLLTMLAPGSPFYLEPLSRGLSPYSTIGNPHVAPEDVAAGQALFRQRCANCHEAYQIAPDLSAGEFKHGSSDWAMFRTITDGVPGTAMQSFDLPDQAVWQVIAYIRSLAGGALVAQAAGSIAPAREVSYEELLAAREHAGEWLTFSGAYDGQRYSQLAQINADNAAALKLIWALQVDAPDTMLEASPIVVGHHMFISVPPGGVLALDTRTGQTIWSYTRRIDERLAICCGQVNRGVAVLGNRVYVGTLDAHLVALDAATGDPVWDTEVAKPAGGYSITSAPLAVKDMIVTGVAGGEFGIRGFLDAYDAESGERVWRFHTIPGEGEPGAETWEGESWRTGGGPTWVTGSFDPGLDLLYWGIGNPAPDFNGEVRRGDNLYTSSIVALDANSGQLAWYFQFTPHDVHDWDANQVPVLVDLQFGGGLRPLLLTANKNGFFYVLDRGTGEFLLAEPFARQSWAEGIAPSGRPIVRPGSEPSEKGTLVYPGAAGAANWYPPSYSALTGLLYVPSCERGKIYFRGDTQFEPGVEFLGSTSTYIRGEPFWTGLRAIDPRDGRIVWEHPGPARDKPASSGGALATGGGLVLWGDGTEFFALDGADGRKLWSVNLGGHIIAPPVTYLVDGRQRITLAAGGAILTFGLE